MVPIPCIVPHARLEKASNSVVLIIITWTIERVFVTAVVAAGLVSAPQTVVVIVVGDTAATGANMEGGSWFFLFWCLLVDNYPRRRPFCFNCPFPYPLQKTLSRFSNI